MKVVIDTNVLVSAALRDRAPEEVVVWVAERVDCHWMVSAEIMTEYKEVLGRPRLALPPERLQHWYDLLDRLTTRVDVSLPVDFPRDRKDAKFLVCARAAEADYLITGDQDFTEARRLINTTILSVSLFKKLVCDAER